MKSERLYRFQVHWEYPLITHIKQEKKGNSIHHKESSHEAQLLSQTCHSGLAQNQYKWQEKSVFQGENLYDWRRYKENPFTFLKKISNLPNFKEENQYFAKFQG